MAKGKLILTYGTYDLLHYGHLLLLRRARALGDSLAVGLSRAKSSMPSRARNRR
jgi:cytidyltransferase-like protein